MHLPDAQVHAALAALFRAGGTGKVGLSTTIPGDESDTGITEPAAGGYARVSIALDGTAWTTPAGRAIETSVDVAFPAPTGDWGTVVAWVVYDATGAVLAAGRLATAKTITAGGSQPVLPAGAIRIEAP